MKNYKNPLRRSVWIGCVIFIVVLGVSLSAANYVTHRQEAYREQEEYIGGVLRYTAGLIDTDDLAECIRTGEKSAKYERLQTQLDELRRTLPMHFLYVIVPLNTDETDNIKNVIAAATQYEYEYEADELVQLNGLTGDSYAPQTAKKYLDAYESGELSFFVETSQWGRDFTGLLPLFDAAGERVAALCMDVDVTALGRMLGLHFLANLGLTLGLGALATAGFLFWTRRRITGPIEQLERCVTEFADAARDPADPDAVTIRLPELRRDDEVASLARAVGRMGTEMNNYLKDVLATEQALGKMTVMAHKDALTRVGNKAAFTQQAGELNEKLKTEPVQFAVVMADTNHLKRVNDTYGHEYGDEYLKDCCAVICEVYRHSPVFRIGGDEFAVLLTGRDYLDRRQLLERARSIFRRRRSANSGKPWKQLSVALGMAESAGGAGETVQAVLARADRNMYQAKNDMKAVK